MKGRTISNKLRWMITISICLFIVFFIPQDASAAEQSGDFRYEVTGVDKDEVRILKYTGSAKTVTIPSKINKLSVTEVSERAFANNRTIQQVFFGGKSVITIGEEAFLGCANLNYIDLSSTKIISIGSEAFRDCIKITDISMPNTLESIGEYAFYGCNKLESITLGNSLKVIEQMAFANCSTLRSIELPKTVSQIWSEDKAGIYGGVFYGCKNLQRIIMDCQIDKIPQNTFYGCSSLANVRMPDTVTEIGIRAFAMCTELRNVRFSNNLTVIQKGAFYYCKKLESVTLPDSLIDLFSETELEGRTFGECTNLKSVVIGKSVMILYPYTFAGCSSLNSIVLPSNINTLSKGVFNSCSKLDKIYFMGNVAKVTDSVIDGCSSNLKFYYQSDQSHAGIAGYNSYVFNVNETHATIMYDYNTEEYNAVRTAKGEISRTISEPIEPQKKGYRFVGWTNKEDGTYWDFSSNIIKDNITLVAQYEVQRYKITYNPRGGNLVTKTKEISYDSIIGKLPIPTRTDYDFVGWYTDINGAGIRYTEHSVMEDRDITLYAHWKLSPKPPTAPVVVLTENSPSQIKLTWKKVSNVSGYDIYRSTSLNGQYTKVGTASAQATGYINKNLVKGRTYYYRVKAFRTVSGQKFYSNYSAKKKLLLTGKPAQAVLTVKKYNKNATDLTWNKLEGAQGYEVFYKTKVSDKYKKFATYNANAYGCYHTKLTSGKTYYYTVRGYTVVNGKKIYGKCASPKKIKL